MSHWTAIKKRARQCHAEAYAIIKDHSAAALLAAAEEITGIPCNPVPASDSLLDGGEAAFDPEAGVIWYNQNLDAMIARYYQAHEYAHYWLHGVHSVCSTEDMNNGVSQEDIPLGIAQVQGYSPQERCEREANIFAREFLLPTDKIQDWFITEGLGAKAIALRVGIPDGIVFHQLTHALLTVEPEGEVTEDSALDLNRDQETAACIPRGPFLLEAGPGTGKTRTLVGRIRYLLRQGVEPHSILALTFSNRAAEEMRARIAIVAPDAATQIWIGTFHAFGLEVLRKYGVHLGLPARLSVLDPIDAVFILERELSALALNYYQNLYEPTTYLGDILDAIYRAKDEVVSSAAYRSMADQMLAKAQSPEEVEVACKAQEVARVYAFYQEYLEREKLLDFGDLIFQTVLLLRNQEETRAHVRQSYPYVLVDEYQDVNRASGLLLQEIAGSGEGLWVVGDARQSIYRFRGAAPINMRLFPEDFPGAKVQALGSNYRSQPVINDLVSALSRQIQATQHSQFVPWHATRPSGGGKVLMEIAEDGDAEARGIAREIERQRKDGIGYSDQAVLCRSHSQLAQVASTLEEADIPTLSLGNFFEREEVRDLLSLLSLACGDGNGLIRVARFGEYAVLISDIRALLTLAREQEMDFPTALALAEGTTALSSAGQRALSQLHKQLEGLCYGRNAWHLLVHYLFERSNYLRPLLNDNSVVGQQKRLALFQLLQLAYRQRGVLEARDRDEKCSFLRYIRRIKIYKGDGQLRQLSKGSDGIDAVRLLTVHAAKGLEFDTVYVPFLGNGYFPASKQGESCPPPKGMLLAEHDSHTEEEECLFFVAVSRARDVLCLSRARRYGRNSKSSPFLALISDHLPHPPDGSVTWPNEQGKAIPMLRAEEPLPIPPVFTADSLGVYRRCPRQYYYESVLGLPGSREDSAYVQFHRCVYKVLRWLQEALQQNRHIDAPTAQVYLADVWQAQGPLDHPYQQIYWNSAEGMVVRAVDRMNATRGKVLQLEWEVALDQGHVQFQPDHVELVTEGLQSSLCVQRFRTGRPSKSELQKDIYALYQVAVQQSYPGIDSRVEIVYLTTDDVQKVSLSSGPINTRLNHYNEAMTGIQRREFPARPDERQCPRCPYFFICSSAEEFPDFN